MKLRTLAFAAIFAVESRAQGVDPGKSIAPALQSLVRQNIAPGVVASR